VLATTQNAGCKDDCVEAEAFEEISADVLSEDERPISEQERADMLTLVQMMNIGERVPNALTFCPTTL